MVKICPISFNSINENLSRLNAGVTLLAVSLFLLTKLPVFLLIILVDFILRNFWEGRFNPITIINKYLIQIMQIPVHMINAGPKIFAARVGLGISVFAVLFLLFGNETACITLAGILGLFSFLEAVFSYCVACKLYPFLLPMNNYFERK